MALQHRELYFQLDDDEQLQCYAQSTISKHNSLDDTLGKAKAKSSYWERKAKESTDKATSAKKERDEATEESHIARLAAIVRSSCPNT